MPFSRMYSPASSTYQIIDTCKKSSNIFRVPQVGFSRLRCVRHSTTLYLIGISLYTLSVPLISLAFEGIMTIFIPLFTFLLLTAFMLFKLQCTHLKKLLLKQFGVNSHFKQAVILSDIGMISKLKTEHFELAFLYFH